MRHIELRNGLLIPVVGTGTNTYGKENRDYMGAINYDTTELVSTISLGYVLFDTAIAYRNEAVVGKGIKESGKERSDFFITSKIPGEEPYYNSKEEVKKAVESSLKALGTDYIDLYLIHKPWDNNEQILMMWNVLEEYYVKGTLKSIGVSNFEQEQLSYLLENATIKPMVNQIQSHPGHWNHELITFSQANRVAIEAWGPLKRVSDESKEILAEIGSKYGKTWSQVILRFQIERDVIVIPKSHRVEGQKENLDLFDFELTEKDKEIIEKL